VVKLLKMNSDKKITVKISDLRLISWVVAEEAVALEEAEAEIS
jgi:hypothetical protein